MRQVMVRYTVKPDWAAENEALVRAVYEELEASEPDSLRYATFKLEDGVSFVHIAETEEGQHPLGEVKAFKEFLAGIGDRCEEPPVTATLTKVGSYRLFAENGEPR
jgi:hypothetical protein